MENKKTLNIIIMLISVGVILTFSLFYKTIANIDVESVFLKVIYFSTLYLSIISTGVALIISFICAFKDNYDLTWFVEFLNICSFLIILTASLSFALTKSIAINLPYFALVLEYFALNLIHSIIRVCRNFKFIKGDFKALFSNSEDVKSNRYGMPEENIEKKSKADKYNLNEKEDNQKTAENSQENTEENSDANALKDQETSNTLETLVMLHQTKQNEAHDEDSIANEEIEEIISSQDENSSEQAEEVENLEETENSEETKNEINNNENEISKEEAQELSDTITGINDDDLTEEEMQEEINLEEEMQEEVERLIEKNKEEQEIVSEENETEELKTYNDDEIKITNKSNSSTLNITDDSIVANMQETTEEDEEDLNEDQIPIDEFAETPESNNAEEVESIEPEDVELDSTEESVSDEESNLEEENNIDENSNESEVSESTNKKEKITIK